VRLGLSALVVTHDQSEAMAMSDRILLLNNGVIEQQGAPQEMYGKPKSLFTAEFMGSNNRLPGRIVEVRDGRARVEGQGWSLWGTPKGETTMGRETTAVIRLEQVKIAQGSAEGNKLKLPLSTSMYLGDKWEHLFRLGAIAIRAHGADALQPGEYFLEFPPDRLWVF
jgi:iron(III) transport system ATP-binding protein